jgi:hypothetical protein
LCYLGWSNHDQWLLKSGTGDNLGRQWIALLRIVSGVDAQSGRIGMSQDISPICLDILAKPVDIPRAWFNFANADVVAVIIHNLNPH